MDHADISELISAYLDGEATPAERAEVERLLESSPRWRTELNEFARLSEMIRGLPRESAPPELAAAVQRQLEKKSLLAPAAMMPSTVAKRSYRREWLAALTGMAATAAAMLVGLQVLEQQRSPNGELVASRSEERALSFSANPPSEPGEGAITSFAFTPHAEETRLADAAPEGARGMPPAAPATAPAVRLSDAAADREESPEERLGESLGVQPEWEDRVRIGDVLTLFEKTSGVVAVVELAVVDIDDAGGQLELALSQNGLKVLPETDGTTAAKDSKGDETAAADAPLDAMKPAGSPQLKVVYVTAPRATISMVLEELGRQGVISKARLQPPVDVVPSAADAEALAENGDGNPPADDQPASVEQAEQALVNEAVVVSQNFIGQNRRMVRQQEVNVPQLTPEAAITARPRVANESLNSRAMKPEKLPERLEEAKRQAAPSSLAVKAKQSTRGAAVPADALIANNSIANNSAVPMTLNPQTGEVTNVFEGYASSAKQVPRKSIVANGGDVQAPKAKFAKEAAPAPAPTAEGGLALADERPIRVLFVVKPAESGGE